LLRTPDGDHRVSVAAAAHPSEIDWRDGDVVIMSMKTQDTESALRALEAAAGSDIPVFCAQNGVENERLASRRFANVYAMLVALPATFLVPGEVIASASPLSGCLHAGRYPSGTDSVAEAVCAGLSGSHFHAVPSPAPMELKYRKLLLNLGNGVEVIVGQSAWGAPGELGEFVNELRAEAVACYTAAGITATPQDEYVERVTRHYRAMPVGGEARNGSSTLQSILRGHQTTEVDYLNGEIELLGRLTATPTPLNSTVRAVATRMAARQEAPGSVTLAQLRELARTRAAR
jgi:2-dehydropantoate 2-reductase